MLSLIQMLPGVPSGNWKDNYFRMNKLLFVLFTALIITNNSSAQPGMGRPPMERIHAAKMAYITDRIHLSYGQAGNFVPLYNEYDSELRNLRQSFFKKYKGNYHGEADEATSRQFIDDDLNYQQQVLDLKRRYSDRFLKVISPRQLADMYKAEREFRQMLMKRLEQRRNGGGGGGRYNR